MRMNRQFERFIAAFCLILSASAALGAPRRILYVTATYGFRHADAIDASLEVMQQLARESGTLEIVHTEDVSLLTAAYLKSFDAIYFFTSGELPLSDQQKADLLEFVRQGKGFGGSHSATDCLYTWPEYGDMIGGYFDGHPWAGEAAVDVEDPQSPLVTHLAPSFRFTEEFYQFRAFSRDQVRVLVTLDTQSVNMSAPGINRTDGDFALAWIRNYGKGRVFYSAFGHFPGSFQLPPMRTMLLKALLWLTGEIDADAAARSGPTAASPSIAADGVRDLSGASGAFAPGNIVTIAGDRLTSGSYFDSVAAALPLRLAGTHVEVNGIAAPLFSVKPDRLLVELPGSLVPGQPASLTVSSMNRTSLPVPLSVVPASPAILAAVRLPGALVLYLTGLGHTVPEVADGAAAPVSPLSRTVAETTVLVSGKAAPVFFSGRAPGLIGVYQINATLPDDTPPKVEVIVQAGDRASVPFVIEP
jgi:type 1 glutamine amidotransferase